MDQLLTDKEYILQKFPGKGGWTFAEIPEIQKDKHAWFGWVKVHGSIDQYQIENYSLMPMGNGSLFLPVKAEIRKKIGKQEGDTVHIVLYSAKLPEVSEDDFTLCLKDEPKAWKNFCKLPAQEQQKLKDRVFNVKNDELRVERIAQIIEKLIYQ